MEWCCAVFKGYFEMAGSRGFGVFSSTQNRSEPAFILQHRAIDPDSPIPSTDFPLSLVSDVHIQFCPWCGANLRKQYAKSYEELDRSELQIKG